MAAVDRPAPRPGAYGNSPAPTMPNRTQNTARSAPQSALPVSASSASGLSRTGQTRVRKARLRLSRIDPWSMMKTSFLFSVAGGIMFWVATYVIWGVIGSSGVFDSVNKIASDVVGNPNDPNGFKIQNVVTGYKVLGFSALIAVIDIVIFTALATLGSFLYNLSATMLGGLEVTLAED